VADLIARLSVPGWFWAVRRCPHELAAAPRNPAGSAATLWGGRRSAEVVAVTAGKHARQAASAARASGVVNLADVLDGQVDLDIACLDRIYLNAYVPNLQVGGQVITFFTKHLDYPIASPALMEQIGIRFRRDVTARPT